MEVAREGWVERAFRPTSQQSFLCGSEPALASDRSVSLTIRKGIIIFVLTFTRVKARQQSSAPPRRPKGPLCPHRSIATLLVCLLLLTSFAAAQNVTGTITNGTTGKPSAGDEVTLLSLSQGMQEIGSTKSDAQGRFSFPAPKDNQAPHMVRATHDGVNYFPQGGPLMPGSTSAELTVYDSAKKVDGLSQTVEVDRLQSDGKQLQGISLYALTNKSEPPRTVANDKGTFEFVLPRAPSWNRPRPRGPADSRSRPTPRRAPRRTITCSAILCGLARRSFRFPIICLTAARPASRPSRWAMCSTSW